MIDSEALFSIFIYYKKYFFISFVVVFAMVVLQHIRTPLSASLATPEFKESNVLETINLKLKQKPFSNFNVHGTMLAEVKSTEDFDKASAYISMDWDSGEVLAQKNIYGKLPIASLTKIMTAVVALDLAQTSDVFIISKNASEQIPTKLGLVIGQKLNLEELLNGLLLVSANDAAKVIEEGINSKYKKNVFIQAMNEKAKLIGMQNTHFENPQGFDGSTHYSSVEDLAILTKYAMTNYPLISEIVKKDYQFYPENENHKQIDMYNWNGLLGVYPGAEGVKIGNTGDAGYTTVVISEEKGRKILAIVLGATTVIERDMWAAKLLDIGFDKYGIAKANITEQDLKDKYKTWKYWN